MYEARQQKEVVSRTIGKSKNKGVYVFSKLTHKTNRVPIYRATQFDSDMLNGYNIIPTQNVNVKLGYNGNSPVKEEWQPGNSTWHHIIPRNELKLYLQDIGNSLCKISYLYKKYNSFACDDVTKIITCGSSIGFEEGVPSQNLGKRYYCHPSNGFLGPASDRRTDDPHNGREKKPPCSFPLSQWNSIFQWANNLSSLSSYIKSDINTNKDNETELHNSLNKTSELFESENESYEKLTSTAYITNDCEWKKTDESNGTVSYSLI